MYEVLIIKRVVKAKFSSSTKLFSYKVFGSSYRCHFAHNLCISNCWSRSRQKEPEVEVLSVIAVSSVICVYKTKHPYSIARNNYGLLKHQIRFQSDDGSGVVHGVHHCRLDHRKCATGLLDHRHDQRLAIVLQPGDLRWGEEPAGFGLVNMGVGYNSYDL